MRSSKIYMQPSCLVALWLLLFFVSTIAILTTLILLAEIFQVKRYPEFGLWSIESILLLILIASWMLWRNATFSKKDFVKFERDHGIYLVNKKTRISPRFYGKYQFAYGGLHDIRVAAIILSPFFSYFPGKGSINFDPPAHKKASAGAELLRSDQTSWEHFQACMFAGREGGPRRQESQVELFSLITGPRLVDITIEIDRDSDKKNIPTTNDSDLDVLLGGTLREVKQFHGRLVWNTECLRLTIIGGSWEGRKFEEKIQKGIEIFKQMNDVLKTKYPVASWEKYQVKWNRSEETFYLAGQ